MYKLIFLFFLIPVFTTAQDKKLFVEGVSPHLYINHKVQPKENYYSIGRIYNISPREIAPFNKLQLENGLSLGQILKIPVATAFFQSGSADADETFIPVYHTLKDKETLSRVAKDYNNLPLQSLKQWNNIKGESVKKGSNLIIGYLKVKKELSALAKNGIGASIPGNELASTQTQVKDVHADKIPEKNTENATATVKTQQQPNKEETAPAKNETTKKQTESVQTVEANNKPAKQIKGGTFKPMYESQEKTGEMVKEEATAGIFKSTSGWTDKKYYCLHNTAAPGTIIKITNPANKKFVFAKVLDLIPDIQQNNNLSIIISNAAADELGATENNYNCLLKYSK